MTPAEIALKMDAITRLTAEELKGWWLYVMIRELRPAFDGERAALMDRARKLGIPHLSQ